MSTTAFLNTLKKYDLQQYYPDFLYKGIRTPDHLLRLSMQDYSKLGVRSIDDKRKFMELAEHMIKQKEQQQQLQLKKEERLQKQLKVEKQQQQQHWKGQQQLHQQIRKDNLPTIPVDSQRKRTTTPFQTTDRKVRRLTVASASSPRHDAISPIPRTTAGRNDPSHMNTRRLSYAPSSKYARVSPIRHNNFNQVTQHTSSPSNNTAYISTTSKSPTRVVKKYSNSPIFIPPVQQPDRHLDAYGIPKSNAKRRLSMENSSVAANDGAKNVKPYVGMSFDEFIESRSVSRQAASLVATTQPKTSTNAITPTALTAATKTASLNQTLSNELQQRIRVCVRKRPLSKKEIAGGESDIAQVVGPHTIQLNAPKTRVDLTRYTEQQSFTFDEAFNTGTSNSEIYDRTARPLVNYVFNGGKATCFAFGQTGSGKTYTMLDPDHGLYIMAARDIFEMLEDPDYNHLSASVGFYEIYQGKLYDLLNKRKQLIPREDGNSNVVITGLLEYPISDRDRLLQIFDFGNRSRTTGKTGANDNSSRSHAVLQVLLKNKKTSGIHGKISFIDLAGSERGADRGEANTKTRLEGAEINKSLLALKECIRALDKDKKHTPFRGSKLTQVLRDSFVGDSRTCMIATISPNNSNSEHTLNTLRYADRVKELKGESDPRLQSDPPLLDNTLYRKDAQQKNSQRDDAQSETTFDDFWDEDAAENLMDVDFPADAISNNAMNTPRSQRVWTETTAPPLQNHLRQPSSPYEERYQQSEENPFLSEQFTILRSPNTSHLSHRQSSDYIRTATPTSRLSATPVHRRMASGTDLSTYSTPVQNTIDDAHDEASEQHMAMNPASKSSLSTTVTDHVTTTLPISANSVMLTNDSNLDHSAHIHGFLRLHRAHIKTLEDCVRREKSMISKMTLSVASADAEHATDTTKISQDFEDYLNNLEVISDGERSCVNAWRTRVKQEFCDEELDDAHGTESPL